VVDSASRVSLRFNEAVEVSLGSVRVFDAAGRRVDDGRVERPQPERLEVDLRDGLPNGTYTVAWRVVSADAHPIRGAFVFHVGAPGAHPEGIAADVLGEDAPPWLEASFAVDRFVVFALLLLAFGGAAALALVVRADDGVDDVRVRLSAALAVVGVLLAVSSLASLPLQGAVAGGLPFEDALGGDALAAVLETRFGEVAVVRAALALLFAGLAWLLVRSRGRNEGALVAALVVGAILIVTPAAAGHAHVSGPLALLSDVAHVQAAAIWAGGLAFLVAALVAAGRERWRLAARAVPRFSTLAVAAVAVLILAGTVNGYLQVRTWPGLWETTYGLLLLAKVGLVVPILALGAYNNRFAVPRLRDGTAPPREQRRFLRTAAVELALLAAVVAVTAVLVEQPPARAQVAPVGPQSAVVPLGAELELNLVVDPAVAGDNEIHLYLSGLDGRPASVQQASVAATLPSRGIGPLRFQARVAGPGHFVVRGAHLAIAGTWQFTVEALEDEFTSLRAAVPIHIRKDER
jgi:copper transport protein